MVVTIVEQQVHAERSIKHAIYKCDTALEQLDGIYGLNTSQTKQNRSVHPILKVRLWYLKSLLLKFQQDDIFNQLLTLGRDSKFELFNKLLAAKFN